MKAKIKATVEIINLAPYAKITLNQCDSWGNPVEMKPEEVELIQEQTVDEHWQDVRERAAIAAMQTLIVELFDGKYLFANNIAISSVEYADALVEQLNKKNNLWTKKKQ